MKKRKAFTDSGIILLFAVLLSLTLALMSACTGNGSENGGEKPAAAAGLSKETGIKDLFKILLDDPLGPESGTTLLYIAEDFLEGGDLVTAEIFLEAARNRIETGRNAGEGKKLWYLSAKASLLRREYESVVDSVDRYLSDSGGNDLTDGSEERRREMLLMKARALLALEEGSEEARRVLLTLWERTGVRELGEPALLSLIRLLIEGGRDDKAAEVLRSSLTELRYNPQGQELWIRYAERLGLLELAEITVLESLFFEGRPSVVERHFSASL
ncbi:MAG TPA: hypothetical protein ENN41_04035, partial [Sediminispirochaeta sp.]|nr:hypothetical protein [Sediminispirochaeta sp.]